MLCRAVEHEVVQGSVESAHRDNPTWQDDSGGHSTDCAQIDVGLPDLEIRERQPAVGRGANPTTPQVVVNGFPGTAASRKAHSRVTSIAFRKPDPASLPVTVPANGRVSR